MSRWKKETSGDVNGLHISTALSASCPALPGLHMASPHLRALHKAALALHCIALLCLALPCFALLCLRFSGAPYRSGKAGRYDPQGGAHGCATFL
ncbi:hypothetical protein [Xanthomonas phaseoli]|uniref:Uncharacterized protein n=1 Tax=Xanthomonas manihotis TaxID=43353 RepID=A0A8I1XP50_XANMN|nr:hypothetical protein [Xanthomonas phaseoli]MBO9721402.1 hypothetical protein [Xanthomonas phaseoli pv. manihotis]MBO9761508.1 hypothetical protein [Xanthomonas phaseoli pv. manihotis]MBO9785341.1 hypothetical protein [Xanthomonas phaseoli pv. manihotis]